ncbi:hypothetical protein [Methanobrevibacter arboriphilus]|uniref:hypothetical protein n=1 Tax=Methanobrevibacter arboriphilus TaxID=39441 RepID=UPI0005B2D498|nr:hypothetical protein [Methanobrevibacter arboriphilus]
MGGIFISRNNIIFIFIIVILLSLLAVFAFNSISDNNVDYSVDDIGGYTFNIPDFLKFESEERLDNGEAKLYSDGNVNLGIIIEKDVNYTINDTLEDYNTTNYTKLKIGDLKVYKTQENSFTGYFFKINNDIIQITFGGAKNTDILVEEMLKNIS